MLLFLVSLEFIKLSKYIGGMILMEFKNHDELVAASKNAAEKWRLVPAPQR
jgi:hypothetical protein